MKIKLFLIVFMILFISGCGLFQTQDGNTQIPTVNAQQDISDATTKIKKSTEVIEEKTQHIAEEATKIQTNATEANAKIPEESKKTVGPHLDSIKESSKSIVADTQEINKSTAQLGSATDTLVTAEEKVETLDKLLVTLKKERDDAIKAKEKALKDKDAQLDKMLNWLIISCIAGAGLMLVVFVLLKSRTGIIGAGCCALVGILAITVKTYMIYLAIAGLGIFIFIIAALIWNIWIKERAFKEVVDTVEVTQDNLPSDVKNKIFGEGDDNGLMNKIQSPSTMSLVKQAKSKLPNLWFYTKEKNGTNNNTLGTS